MLSLPAAILADGLAPSLARWSESREREILDQGRPLPDELITFARKLGIKNPENIRVEIRSKIPLPLSDSLLTLAKKLRFPVFHPAGMCLGRGLCCYSLESELLRHELVHTLQFQQLESHQGFMWQYVFECLRHGYLHAPLEIEARSLSQK